MPITTWRNWIRGNSATGSGHSLPLITCSHPVKLKLGISMVANITIVEITMILQPVLQELLNGIILKQAPELKTRSLFQVPAGKQIFFFRLFQPTFFFQGFLTQG